jgi:HlyD family secretion protein
MRRVVLVVPAVAALVAVAVWLWPEEPLALAMAPVERGVVEQVVANTRAGTVNACQRSKLSMPMGGRVERLHVHEGDHVRAGTILLEIWNDDREAQLAQVRAAYQVALEQEKQACISAEQGVRDVARVNALAQQDLVSGDAVEQTQTRQQVSGAACAAARAQAATSRAAVRVQEAWLEETRLRAPFAGTVAEINGEIGEYVTPSPPGVATPPAVDLIDDSCLYVTAPIDEVDAAQVKVGMEARISMDAFRGRQFAAKVQRIAPYVVDKEKQARTVDVEVRFDAVPKDISLLAGYSADVDIVLSRHENVLRVPAEALVDGKRVWVWDAATGIVSARELQTGIANWNWLEISAGLREGEQVVTSLDAAGLGDGIKAVVQQDKPADAAP